MELPADENTRDDPADGAEHPDIREAARIGEVMKGNGVRQRQGRHVAQGVQNQERIERRKRRLLRNGPHQSAADQVQPRQQLFASEEAIRHDAHEKGREQRGNCGCTVREADLSIREVQRLTKVRAHGHEPHAPDEVLERHHQGEARPFHRNLRMRTLRRASAPA